MPDQTVTVPEPVALWMVVTGHARRLDDGTLELTAQGARWTIDRLRQQRDEENRADA